MTSSRYKIYLFITLKVLCLIYAVPLFAQNKVLKSSKDYLNIIKYYRYLNPDSALFYAKEGLQKAEKEQNLQVKAALLNQYGMINDNATRYSEAREKYLAAEAIYRSLKDNVGVAATLIRLGVVERRKGNFDKSFSYAVEALKISEKNNHKLGMLEARLVLAEAYYDLQDYENCLKNLNLAVQIDRSIPLSNLSLNMYDDFGSVYIKLKDYDKAIHYIRLGLAKSNKVEYNGLKISLLKTLGRAYSLKGYRKEAEDVLKEALAFSRKIKNVLREHAILTELASIYERQQPDTALKYLNEALQIVDKYKMYRQEITVLNKISTLHKQKGELVKALQAKEKSSALAEQVFYKDMMKQVFSLEAAYELEKSKVKLNELTTKGREQQLFKNISLSIAVFAFIILVVIAIYYFRSRKLNKLLTKANKKLEESNEVKDKFFSIVAHDIRSPLVSTISILKLIGNNELDEATQSSMVNKLVLHCDSSLEILDKLLKWGQMQIKGVRLNITQFHPLININKTLTLLQDAAQQKQINISVDVSKHFILNADADHFDFVIRNLLANAIKFTYNGGAVRVSANLANNDMVKFEVADNGVGISPARIGKLFDLSATGTKGTSAEEGTSLGLIICKEFVLANDGQIEVHSKLGKGTTFSFTIKGFLQNFT